MGHVISKSSLLALTMVEQPIIWAVVSSVEMFGGTNGKFELWIASVENAAQSSKQDILPIAFSQIIGSPLTSSHRFRDCLPYMIWKDLKSGLSRQY